MTLQASGTITMAQINAEFGRGNNLNAYRGTTWYTDAGGSGTFSTGAISMSDFYGKSKTSPSFNATISSHQQQLDLRTWCVNNGWDQTSPAIITLASGIYIWSDDINTPALTISGSFPNGVTLINNGYIMGKGGMGGGSVYNGSAYTYNTGIQSGGPAISLGVSCTIQNNSYIGGGGGGGGCAGSSNYLGGGGAGGGAGGGFNNNGTWSYGGAGGSIGSSGASSGNYLGGGGGRIMPGSDTTNSVSVTAGTTATATSIGGGGSNNGYGYASPTASNGTSSQTASAVDKGGSGGGTGSVYAGISSSTSTYNFYTYAGGGGGGWGASGGQGNWYSTTVLQATYSGAVGGKCVNLNGYSITWSATGTRYGGIS